MTDLSNFLRSEDGAVTVDWVVLTAAILALGVVTSIVTFGEVKSATKSLTAYIASSVELASSAAHGD